MKQAAVGCLIGLGGWLGVAAGIAWYLQARHGHTLVDTLGVAGGAGLIALGGARLLYSAFTAWRERSALLGGIAGVQPSDGPGAVLVGTLEPLGGRLRAPLDGLDCLAYSYAVTEDRGTGRKRVILTHFKGVGLAPSTIVTASGSFRLLTVPDLDAAAPGGTASDHVAAFERYAGATAFTGAGTSAQELLDCWSDADGAYRSDVAYASLEAVNLVNCRLVQQAVRPGARVCVFGTFSAEKCGIVPSATWAASPRLMVGNVEQVAASLGSTAKTRLVLGILISSGAAGLVAAFIANG